MTSIDISLTGGLESVMTAHPASAIALVDGKEIVAFVVPARELTAIQATQSLLATNGSMAAIAEGLADLAGGRQQLWSELRGEHGRASEDETPPLSDPLVSHRARWDLELLTPATAQLCFNFLDLFARDAPAEVGLPVTAGFSNLRLVVTDGFRLVIRPADDGIRVVHVDSAPEGPGTGVLPLTAP